MILYAMHMCMSLINYGSHLITILSHLEFLSLKEWADPGQPWTALSCTWDETPRKEHHPFARCSLVIQEGKDEG